MAFTLDCPTTEAIGLNDYLNYMSSKVDFRDIDQVLETGSMLKALSNNRDFLVEVVNKELLSWREFQPANGYTAQTLMLGGAKDFFVRANMWTPPAHVSGPTDWEKDLYYYNFPHDHNFSFMTVGYFGSGYATSIYEYDPEDVSGYPGEHVNLRFLEKTTLPAGKLMFYRAGRDVHSQEHPEEFSISLNLMLIPSQGWSNQYQFDLGKNTIANFVKHSTDEKRLALCNVAGMIGNDSTVGVLETISSGHEAPRVRAAAYEALSVLNKGEEQAMWSRAIKDKHPLVRNVARQFFDGPAR